MAGLDITGERYGRLTAVRRTGESTREGLIWECRCDCGGTKNVAAVNLRRGRVTSCGCARRSRDPAKAGSPGKPRPRRAPGAAKREDVPNPFGSPRRAQRAFWKFVVERQSIWYRRVVEGRAAPWTDDPTLQLYRFGSLQRELDRSTIELIKELQAHERGHTLNTIVFRRLNHTEAWRRDVGWLDDLSQVEPAVTRLQQSAEAGLSVQTAAWQPQRSVADNIQSAALGAFENRDLILTACRAPGSLEPLWRVLQKIEGIGPYLAWQIALDLRYVHPELSDDVWAYAGPGGRSVSAWIRPDLADTDPQELIRWLRDRQPDALNRVCWEMKPRFTMADVENGLCEFRKYVNWRDGATTKAIQYLENPALVSPVPVSVVLGTAHQAARRASWWERFRR